MKVLVVADELRKKEFLSLAPQSGSDVEFADQLPFAIPPDTGLVIDLLFQPQPLRIEQLQQTGAVIMVNAQASHQLIPRSFIRINGWPGFLGGPVIEASGSNRDDKDNIKELLAPLNRHMEWVSDDAVFIGQRVVSCIINEAYLLLGEGIATAEGIDLAMKLGTNYPYGPFEWANLIGLSNVVAVLAALNGQQLATGISILLKEKALAQ